MVRGASLYVAVFISYIKDLSEGWELPKHVGLAHSKHCGRHRGHSFWTSKVVPRPLT
jgi:hypothetical protein